MFQLSVLKWGYRADPAAVGRSLSMSRWAGGSRWRSTWWARLSQSCWADSQAQTPTLEALGRHNEHDIIQLVSVMIRTTRSINRDSTTGTVMQYMLFNARVVLPETLTGLSRTDRQVFLQTITMSQRNWPCAKNPCCEVTVTLDHQILISSLMGEGVAEILHSWERHGRTDRKTWHTARCCISYEWFPACELIILLYLTWVHFWMQDFYLQ